MFNTPVLLLIFNRLETTKLVFEAIRKRQPAFLFIAADGPRTNKEGEKEITDLVRNYVIENIDWDCEVKTLFRDENLGCGRAVSEGISWFFDNVESGIILEDDCLPEASFFNFCEELLNLYKYNSQIVHISGNNFQDESTSYNCSYYYSKYPNSWGWATWKRAWKIFDLKLEKEDYDKKINSLNNFKNEKNYFKHMIKYIKAGNYYHIWDFQWLLTTNIQKGLCIVPAINLVTNIGFGEAATHTFGEPNLFLSRETFSIRFPLVHNSNFEIDVEKDKYLYFSTTYTWMHRGSSMKLFLYLKHYFNRIIKLFLA